MRQHIKVTRGEHIVDQDSAAESHRGVNAFFIDADDGLDCISG